MLSLLSSSLLLLFGAAPAHASAPAVVQLVIGSETKEGSGNLVAVLSAQLQELGVDVVVREPGHQDANTEQHDANTQQETPLSLIWIRSIDEQVVIQFYEPQGVRLRVRRVPLRGKDPASVEEVALIVRSYVDAVMLTAAQESTEASKEPLEAAPPHPRPPPSDSNASYPQVRAEVGYATMSFASRTPWQHGVRGSLGLAQLGTFERVSFNVGLAYTFLPPLFENVREIELRVSRHPLELHAGVRFEVNSWLALEPRLRLEVDILHRQTMDTPSVEASRDQSRTTVAAGVQLWSQARLWANGGVYVHGGADTMLRRFDYVISSSDEEEIVLAPRQIRPQLGGGIWFSFL